MSSVRQLNFEHLLHSSRKGEPHKYLDCPIIDLGKTPAEPRGYSPKIIDPFYINSNTIGKLLDPKQDSAPLDVS